jgi:hypothetical protein
VKEIGNVRRKNDPDMYNERSIIRDMVMLVIIVAMFAGCGQQQETGQLQQRVDGALNDISKDRHTVRLELMELRRDIDVRILATEEELLNEGMPVTRRAEKEDLHRELVDQRNRVQQALLEVEAADESSWIDIRDRSRQMTRQVDAWFDRKAEQEDIRAHSFEHQGYSV